MRRQQRASLENLSNVYIQFKTDSSISGKGGCNSMSGRFTVKGTSIKFHIIVSTKMACANLDKENAFFRLLQSTVSAYTVEGKTLLLRDGASNILFECEKR
ncbi:MAG: hypothetical protein C4308_00875 [Chitinophagaceae bacterium]